MRVGGLGVTGRFDPDHAPKMGEEVNLGLDMPRASPFDSGTRRLI